MKKIIIVVPCYNEEESLPHLVKAVAVVRKEISKKYQLDVLLVNDGSSDSTQNLIVQLCQTHPYIYFREFSNNAGHQTALRAGINAAINYDAVVMLDADLQQPPELIPKMIKSWENGAKVVQMVRSDDAREVGSLKYVVRKSYYRFINSISELNMEYGASDFRLIDRTVAQAVASSPEKDLFLRGYFSWLPVSRTTIDYKPQKRIAGTSKYTLKKLLALTNQSILQFSEKPLSIAVSIGILMAFLSFLYGLILIISQIFGYGPSVSGWTSLMVVMLFCFGLNFILLGIIGKYLAHSITIQKRRPDYVIASEKIPGNDRLLEYGQ